MSSDDKPWGPGNPTGTLVPLLQASVEAERVKRIPPLTTADRCDAGCGAAALYRWWRAGNGVLDFCGHHSARHADRLDAGDWTIIEGSQA
ncbi:DUF7455 domain-containing protein [Streptomyces sp. NPDC055085]